MSEFWKTMSESEKKDWVYARLEDEESRDIFSNKNSYNESKDVKYIENIIEKYLPELSEYGAYYNDKEKDFLKSIWNKNQKIIVFGAGFQGRRLLDMAKETGIRIAYVCDNAPEKQHTVVGNGTSVISLQELCDMEDVQEYTIIVTPQFKGEEIKEMLIDGGIKEQNISLLNKYLMYILDEKQYFDEDIVKLQDGEAFVDAGSLNLGTTIILMDKMRQKGYAVERVWAFEPDDSSYRDCKKTLTEKGMEKVELINAGLWCRNTNLAFQYVECGGSRIVESDEKGYVQVKVVALDSCIQDKVTFIKMDIEGAELEALKGAKRLIMKYRPKLAICIYHKREDMWEIPYFIKDLVPEYKLYIRHYSNHVGETVLYAI